MSDWKPSSEYQRVAEANRQFYARTASLYDASETCVTNRRIQQRLEADLDRIIGISGRRQGTIRALDACGGSGNVALKLLNRGVDVTLVDISQEFLGLFSAKCAASGISSCSPGAVRNRAKHWTRCVRILSWRRLDAAAS